MVMSNTPLLGLVGIIVVVAIIAAMAGLALSGTDLRVQLLFNQDVDGNSVIPAGSFTDNAKSAGIGFTASWQNTLDVDLRYNAFFGDGDLTDRDNVSVGIKYRF